MDRDKVLKAAAVAEILAAAVCVLLDVLIPTLVILAIMAVSMLLRREKPAAVGFKKTEKPVRLILTVFALSAVWTLVDFGLILPVLNHLTGMHQDVSAFENLKGNVGQLLFLLAAGWILGGFCEEVAYRGYLQNRISALLGGGKAGGVLAIVLTSVLFGLAHTEQGFIGVSVTMLDAIFFSLLRLKLNGNLWAPVLAHGFSNTIGIVVFFFAGPLYGLW